VHQAVIISTGQLAKKNISHSDIAYNIPQLFMEPFNIISVDDILSDRIPKISEGGLIVTGYSDRFLREDLEIRKIPRINLKNSSSGSMENNIQMRIHAISNDFNAGSLWFLILSDTLPHAEAFKDYCWWHSGPFIGDSAVSEIRISQQGAGNIDLVTFENDPSHGWVETAKYSFFTRMLV
jgi:hypothetical protein